jgi:hypothetical protein
MNIEQEEGNNINNNNVIEIENKMIIARKWMKSMKKLDYD